jgi:hypothetical protein
MRRCKSASRKRGKITTGSNQSSKETRKKPIHIECRYFPCSPRDKVQDHQKGGDTYTARSIRLHRTDNDHTKKQGTDGLPQSLSRKTAFCAYKTRANEPLSNVTGKISRKKRGSSNSRWDEQDGGVADERSGTEWEPNTEPSSGRRSGTK